MRSFIAILLSSILLTSSMGITMSTHYCHGKAIKSHITLGKQAIGCGMAEESNSCQSKNRNLAKKQGCCSNKFLSIDLDDNYQPSIADFNTSVDFVNRPANHYAAPYVHSEVQASTDVVGADRVVTDTVNKIIGVGQHFMAGSPKPDAVRVVILNMHIHGSSVPNTVCGNACKPALAELFSHIQTEIEQKLGAIKPQQVGHDIFIRRGEHYTFNAYVNSEKVFQTPGKGATSTSNATPTSSTHKQTIEFKP